MPARSSWASATSIGSSRIRPARGLPRYALFATRSPSVSSGCSWSSTRRRQAVNEADGNRAAAATGEDRVIARLSTLDRFLPLWIALAMGAGLGLGSLLPSLNDWLDKLQIGTVSLPICSLSSQSFRLGRSDPR